MPARDVPPSLLPMTMPTSIESARTMCGAPFGRRQQRQAQHWAASGGSSSADKRIEH